MNTDRFKFRVWDNEEKCYSTACFFLFGEGELFVFIGGVFHKANKERYTVEQCTGLKDENGKLIFEGDKIRMTEFYFDGFGEEERNFVGYVMWNKGEFVLSKNKEKPEYENETEIIPHLSWGHSFEIIGNIHDGTPNTAGSVEFFRWRVVANFATVGGDREMKIQKFEITIAVPDENDPVKPIDLVETLRNRLDEFNAENCAVEGKEVEK